jgi:tetratricopeptide (TPR) repeat protein
VPPLERSVELCRATPAPALLDVCAAHLGYAYALSGHLPEGVALLEEAVADPGATGSANHPLFLAYLGEAHLLAGRRDDALAVARRALDLAHRQKERTTARPSPGPTSSGCVRSSPTATSGSGRSTGGPATQPRRRST